MFGTPTAETNGFYVRVLAVGSGAAFEKDWDVRASASPKPLDSAVAVVFVCWGNAWARASRVSTCVGMYAKPLVPAISSVLYLWGLLDIPRVGGVEGYTHPCGVFICVCNRRIRRKQRL